MDHCRYFYSYSAYYGEIIPFKVMVDLYKINNQLDATKCWFIFSTCFEYYYAHPQEYISEYRFLVSKPGKYE
jgi:hypothetical protein